MGGNIVAVSKRVGHKNVTQTLNTYSHYMPKDDEHILSVFSI
jgi:integrase